MRRSRTIQIAQVFGSIEQREHGRVVADKKQRRTVFPAGFANEFERLAGVALTSRVRARCWSAWDFRIG